MKIAEDYFKSYGMNHFLYDALCNRMKSINFLQIPFLPHWMNSEV